MKINIVVKTKIVMIIDVLELRAYKKIKIK